MKWSYGVTTVPSRIKNGLLGMTLESLSFAGFERPRIFLDGGGRSLIPDTFTNEVTCRIPRAGLYGNWLLSLLELYLRDANADRYAIFQDDLVTYRNLRDYLEAVPFPTKGYLNLYTFDRSNGGLVPHPNYVGFYLSNQLGRGALGLVFDNEGVRAFLTARHMIDRCRDEFRGWRVVDGAVSETAKQLGYSEYVHMPSLVQHVGLQSTISKDVMAKLNDCGRAPHVWASDTQSSTFRGVNFDATDFLPK